MYRDRIAKLQKMLDGVQALYVDDLTDLYYLTGEELTLGKMVVKKESAVLIVDGRYFEGCAKRAPVEVKLLNDDALKEAISGIKEVGFCAEKTTVAGLKKLSEVGSFVEVEDFVKALREVKGKGEIEKLKEVAELGSKGFDFVCSILKEGISEKEVARELEIFWLKEGGDTLAFDPIIAFGKATSMPHYHPTSAKLKKGDAVLIDIGVKKDHYHSDMTRVVFFGAIDPNIQDVYELVKESQQKALDACKAGVTNHALDAAARTFIKESGFEKEFCHGLGHGVGLEIHEGPTLSYKGDEIKLQAGMVITIEPGIYLPGIGGVRIEDTVVVTEEGHINLTDRPKEIRVI